MNDNLRKLGIYALITTTIYLIWLFIVVDGLIGYVFLALELLMSVLVYLFVINHWARRYQVHGGKYSMRNVIDIFITTKDEPIEILQKTLASASDIEYPNKRIYLLDDGARGWVKQIAEEHQCAYLVRPDRLTKQTKAANLNYGLSKSFGNYILVLDADDQAAPTIIDDMLGHFKKKKVGLVASRKRFLVDEKDFNNDNLFYEYMQSGKNDDGSAISCGSGVMYRRSALDEIGGFQEWNIVEDLYTSYILNTYGYRTEYINQHYVEGIAPRDLKIIYKQRGLWARDTLRLFFWHPPLFNKRLSLRQRLHYFELGYIYLASAFFIPAVYYLNFYSIFFNDPILHVGYWYLVFKLPSFYFILYMYNSLGQGDSSSRMWASLFPVFLRSSILALLYKKPVYTVTPKKDQLHPRFMLVLPQALTIVIGIIVIIYHLQKWGATSLLTVNVFWFIIMVYWLWPVFPKAFPSSKISQLRSTYVKNINR